MRTFQDSDPTNRFITKAATSKKKTTNPHHQKSPISSSFLLWTNVHVTYKDFRNSYESEESENNECQHGIYRIIMNGT